MNDDEIRSPDDVEFEEVDVGKPQQNRKVLKPASNVDEEFSSVALSEARNNHDEEDEGPQISEETPSESAPLDSQLTD